MAGKGRKGGEVDFRTKLVDVKGLHTDIEKIEVIEQKVKRYFRRFASGYVGISSNPKNRVRQHNKKILKDQGDARLAWPICYVIHRTSSYDQVRRLKKRLTALAEARYGENAWNRRRGGGGRNPKPGARGFIYLLLDPRMTVWT